MSTYTDAMLYRRNAYLYKRHVYLYRCHVIHIGVMSTNTSVISTYTGVMSTYTSEMSTYTNVTLTNTVAMSTSRHHELWHQTRLDNALVTGTAYVTREHHLQHSGCASVGEATREGHQQTCSPGLPAGAPAHGSHTPLTWVSFRTNISHVV